MPESRGVAGSTASQTLTAGSPWELITQVSAHLHRIARQWDRDRWWFLGGERLREPEKPPPGMAWLGESPEPVDLKAGVVGRRVILTGSARGLSCVGRVVWNMGPQKRPLLLLDFTSQGHRLTIEVAFGEQRQAVGIFTKRAVRGLSRAERQHLWRIFRRPYPRGTSEVGGESPRVTIEAGWGEPMPGAGIVQSRATPYQRSRERLWIDPQAPASEWVTRFLMLLYLWRHNLIVLSPDDAPQEWDNVKKFLGRWGVKNDDEASDVLNCLREKYGFPDRWKGTLAYIGRVVRDLWTKRSRPEIRMTSEIAEGMMERHRRGKSLRLGRPESPPPEDPDSLSPDTAAAVLGVSRETVYRWARKGKLAFTHSDKGRLRFERAAVEKAGESTSKRRMRQRLMVELDRRGMKPEAAKKFIQRQRRRGMDLVDIGRKLAK